MIRCVIQRVLTTTDPVWSPCCKSQNKLWQVGMYVFREGIERFLNAVTAILHVGGG